MSTELSLQIVGDDAEELERGALDLRREIGALEVDDVSPGPAEVPPEGTRGIPVAAIGSLLVSLNPTAKALLSVVLAVRGWLSHSGSSRTVKLKVGDDVLELTGVSSAAQDKLVDDWIRAHAKDAPPVNDPAPA
jgi:hypothetical protein